MAAITKAYEWVHTENAIDPSGKSWCTMDTWPKEIGVGPDFLGWLTDPIQTAGSNHRLRMFTAPN